MEYQTSLNILESSEQMIFYHQGSFPYENSHQLRQYGFTKSSEEDEPFVENNSR